MSSSKLQFQDFSLNMDERNTDPATTDYRPTGQIGDQPDYFSRKGDRREGTPTKSFFSFDFYQHYFDVDTDQVVTRVLNSMVPRFGMNFITDYIQPVPDLYGPFWICVTLVFTTAICGNLAKYIETSGDVKNHQYESDFRLVTGASTLIACYVILLPFVLYSLFWYRKSEMQYSYLEILCAYAYSLSIFIPVSVLWVINVQAFRWVLIIISVVLSGSVLVGSFWPALKNDRNRMLSFVTVGGILLLHCLLAIAFKEFYFDTSYPVRDLSGGRPPLPGGFEGPDAGGEPVLPHGGTEMTKTGGAKEEQKGGGNEAKKSGDGAKKSESAEKGKNDEKGGKGGRPAATPLVLGTPGAAAAGGGGGLAAAVNSTKLLSDEKLHQDATKNNATLASAVNTTSTTVKHK